MSSVDSTPIESKRFLIVPSLSSAARIPLPSATSARAVVSKSAIAHLLAREYPAAATLPAPLPAQIAGTMRPERDPPRGMDLGPAVRRVPHLRPDDGDARARVGNRHDGAVLRDHLDDEVAVAGAQPDVDVAVELLELHLRHDAGRDRAALLHLEPLRVVDAGERRAAAAVRRRRRRGVRADEQQQEQRAERLRRTTSANSRRVTRQRRSARAARKTLVRDAGRVYLCRERGRSFDSGTRFAHPPRRSTQRLLDEYGIPWEYEPHTFLLETDEDGRVLEAVTPDFYLPTVGAYVECTTAKPRLISRKRRKARKLRDRYGHIVTLLERDDLERLLAERRRGRAA